MTTIIIFTIFIIVITLLFKYNLEGCKNHKIHITWDSYGSIQVFDNSLELIAICYKDRTIEFQRECSFWKQTKIRNISDHFEEYAHDLIEKGYSICL